jgi:hypothetical protein
MSDLTPLEAAERLKDIKEQMLDNILFDDAHALDYAAYYLRAIAAGEYKPVVHAHWKQSSSIYNLECSNCGAIMDESEMRQTDGKDDSHEANL